MALYPTGVSTFVRRWIERTRAALTSKAGWEASVTSKIYIPEISSTMESKYQEAIDAKEIAGAILTAHDSKFHYAKTFGSRTTIDGTEKALEINDILYLASSTKLLTTIAALQCIDRGLLTLTDPVPSHLMPELASIQVLSGFGEDSQPIMEDKSRPITLQQLLTHSSGFRYDMMDPVLRQWQASRNESPQYASTVESRLGFPLSFQPGTSWSYGVSVDWAGKLVERASGKTLEEFMCENIWKPLGFEDSEATFWPMARPRVKERMVDYNPKDPKGAGLACTGGHDGQSTVKDCFGGQGVYSSAPAYLQILHSLLVNDGKLLKPETADLMFQPQLSPEAHASFHAILSNPETNAWFGQGTPVNLNRDFGLGGLLTLESVEGWYGKGTLMWGGGLNSAWFVDRENGLCGFGAPQLLRRTDDAVLAGEMKGVWRRGIYEVWRMWKGSGQEGKEI
ncbi:MAG: hypothetical protein MMC33_006252 [Icmadophila ericetorum]|nr:hypothetical protein [Icmadophila ericetorum]